MSVVSFNYFKKNRKKLKKVVLIGGAFDILHVGHIHHFRKAKSFGNTLVVHITSDRRVRAKKGPGRPIFGENQRAEVVAAIRFVDFAFVYGGRHYDQEVIDRVRPDILLFNQEAYLPEVQERVENLKNFQGRVIVTKDKKEDSTTRAIAALSK